MTSQVLLVEETGVSGKNHRLTIKSLTCFKLNLNLKISKASQIFDIQSNLY